MIVKRHNIDFVKLALLIFLLKILVAMLVLGYLDNQAKPLKWILKAINFVLTVLKSF